MNFRFDLEQGHAYVLEDSEHPLSLLKPHVYLLEELKSLGSILYKDILIGGCGL